jgi:hypothetical protein
MLTDDVADTEIGAVLIKIVPAATCTVMFGDDCGLTWQPETTPEPEVADDIAARSVASTFDCPSNVGFDSMFGITSAMDYDSDRVTAPEAKATVAPAGTEATPDTVPPPR